jgi:hypothetical protein
MRPAIVLALALLLALALPPGARASSQRYCGGDTVVRANAGAGEAFVDVYVRATSCARAWAVVDELETHPSRIAPRRLWVRGRAWKRVRRSSQYGIDTVVYARGRARVQADAQKL